MYISGRIALRATRWNRDQDLTYTSQASFTFWLHGVVNLLAIKFWAHSTTNRHVITFNSICGSLMSSFEFMKLRWKWGFLAISDMLKNKTKNEKNVYIRKDILWTKPRSISSAGKGGTEEGDSQARTPRLLTSYGACSAKGSGKNRF